MADQEHIHLQFFGDANPTRADVLVALRLALDLIESSLAIAMRHVGAASLSEQAEFWGSFWDFEKETDLFGDYPSEENYKVAIERIADFRENIEVLLIQERRNADSRMAGDLNVSD